ncbi:unnamed protein product [Effrenium voratum]|nr:unnamed protein product [Effrenium voratum]CAJ1449747.1 unnamed protein product [Effrenium voratum]
MENLMRSFPERSFDVTNWIEVMSGMLCCLITRKTLEMQREEVVLKTSNCCCNFSQRRPYAQLTLLEQRSLCFGICQAINSDLQPMNEKGEGGIVPGCGCSKQLVDEIVYELNLRKDGRGKIAQMRQQKYMLDRISKLAVQLPLLLKKIGAQYPPSDATLQRLFGEHVPLMRSLAEVAKLEQLPEFGSNQYDVTCCLESLCCVRKVLELAPDEGILTTKQFITGSVVTSRVPYANIASVDVVRSCGCLALLQAGELTKPPGQPHKPLQPGCGCSGALVDMIRGDLQARVDVRGNLGQIRQLEKMMGKFDDFAAEVPLMLDKLGADAAFPPSQQTMQRVYGSQSLPQAAFATPHEVPSQNFASLDFNVRNEFLNCCCLAVTCGLAGCTSHTATLEAEQMTTRVSNNCTTSIDRQPYAQLRAVDEELCCFCCHSVNGMIPGWCGDVPKLHAIAGELQARKVGRGNIAQLRNQENTMIKALHTDIHTDVLLSHAGVAYPPTQETMAAVYGASPPQLPPGQPGEAVHLSASEQMETRHYDITNTCARLLCCCLESHLELNEEEAIFRGRSCCVKSVRREPYAQLGSVAPAELCCGACVNVKTDQNVVCPGCGCNRELTTEVAAELQNRKVKRGNIAQIQLQENLMMEIIKLGVKADLLLHKYGVEYPPSQETMLATFGAGVLPRAVPANAMQVVVPAGLRAGDAFQVAGPTGRIDVTVPSGAVEGQILQVELPASPLEEAEMAPFTSNAA